ncbi:SIS domain-containing protein [Nocardioides nanhaiensis]|uniref:SIS domain-containing protein n=1 Tax=Nocardioides nanhaiensis TaxID=1476871 RepID=A0ABP8WYW7_9ACTN
MSSLLEQEIAEQPEVAARLLDRVRPDLAAYAGLLRSRGSRGLVTVARGSSAHAAHLGRTLVEVRLGLASGEATPSSTTAYGRTPAWDDRAVVAVSQSGASPDVVAVVTAARAAGRPTLAVTNDPASPLARAAEAVLDLGCSEERSVAATKTYTASALALALLVVALDDGRGLAEAQAVPDALAAAVTGTARLEELEEAAALLAAHDRAVVVGRGYSAATARETALKLTELTGTLAMPFTPADLLHGPVAAVGPEVPVLLLPGAGPAAAGVRDLLPELARRGAPVLQVVSGPEEPGLPTTIEVRLPAAAGVADWLEPVVGVVPGQLLAWRTAERRGVEVDHPGGLTKVTLTH